MPAISGNPPKRVQRFDLPDNTNWTVYTLPSWVRAVGVRNAEASGTLMWANDDQAAGAFTAATDHYRSIPALTERTEPVTSGRPRDSGGPQIVLGSSTANMTVELTLYAAP